MNRKNVDIIPEKVVVKNSENTLRTINKDFSQAAMADFKRFGNYYGHYKFYV